MAKLAPIDFAFLATETPESPKHVAGLQIFETPAGNRNKKRFVQDLFEALREHTECTRPFNRKVKAPLIGMPEWVEDDNLVLS